MLPLKPTQIKIIFLHASWIILHYQLQDYGDYLLRVWRQRQKRQGEHTMKILKEYEEATFTTRPENYISYKHYYLEEKFTIYFICIRINFTQISRLEAELSKDIQTSRWWRITIVSEESEIGWFLKLVDTEAGAGEKDGSDVKS